MYTVGLFYYGPEHSKIHRMFWKMQGFCAQWDVRGTTGITAMLYICRPFLPFSEDRPCCGNEGWAFLLVMVLIVQELLLG